MQPAMTGPETELFKFTLARKNALLEFGCGGSTVFAIQQNMPRIVSVESDRLWIEKVSENELVKAYRDQGRIGFFHADIGPTSHWGYPENNDRIADWPNYWRGVWKTITPGDIDVVLVDGRFRVACALYALTRMRADACMVFHDFWSRPEYHIVLEHTNCISSVDDMAVLAIRADTDRHKLFDDLISYAIDQS